MASTEEILVDLQATVSFVTNEITEHADSTAIEEAVPLIDELERVARAVKDAITMLNGSVLKQVENGSRQIGTRVYAAKPDFLKRTDHTKVRKLVIDQAVNDAVNHDDGVISARTAADRATEYMMDLYVPPSKVATTRGLKRIGASVKAVNHFEDNGKKLVVVDLAAPKDDDEDDG